MFVFHSHVLASPHFSLLPHWMHPLRISISHVLCRLCPLSHPAIFRECGGARCAHNLVPYFQCRHQALDIVQQLIYSKDGGDDMETLVIIMQSAEFQDLQLKIDIIQVCVKFRRHDKFIHERD